MKEQSSLDQLKEYHGCSTRLKWLPLAKDEIVFPFFFLLFLKIHLFYVYECFLGMYLYHVHGVPFEARRECWIP